MLPRRIALYFHTLRYLKPRQIWGRLVFRLHRPRPDLRPAPPLRSFPPFVSASAEQLAPLPPAGQEGTAFKSVPGSAPAAGAGWVLPARRPPSLLARNRCQFLNEEGVLIWNNPAKSKLWLYNLHYFDDLNALDAPARLEWHRELIARWVAENPPGLGGGWEPYPLSLRVVNWIKWSLAGNELGPEACYSLAVQARWLTGRLEYHLLGNHLFANAKALVFAGSFFAGPEAEGWLRQGMAILQREIPEQILSDGGQFERSPMYHALAYEDMLDLTNLAAVFPAAFAPWRALLAKWPELLGRMGRWLAAMCHPDGEISFFNDAAMGIAPAPAELFAYAQRLGIPQTVMTDGVVWLRDSGYVRVQQAGAVLLADVAPIGPDCLPGHAHADTLSYELSLAGQRVVVNSGTSCYGLGPQRQQERSTAAHSTLEIDGQDSSEVWAGFRVARRARPFDEEVLEEKMGSDTIHRAVVVEAAHDGYRRLPGSNMHYRKWRLASESLVIEDKVTGQFDEAVARFHLHPDVQIEPDPDNREAVLRLPLGQQLLFKVEGGELGVEAGNWHPQFGTALTNHCLVVKFRNGSIKTFLRWIDS